MNMLSFGSRNLTLMELEAGECKFATNNAKGREEHLFCGQPVKEGKEGKPYCAHHCSIVYQSKAATEDDVVAASVSRNQGSA